MEGLIPEDILPEILSRLSIEAVLKCRQVCKAWRMIIQNDYFGHMHLLRQLDDHKYQNDSNVAAKGGLSLLLDISFCGDAEESGTQLHYVECQYDSYKVFKRINQPPIEKHIAIVNSCNGLICFCETLGLNIYEPLYISNPITREYVDLPRLSIKNDDKLERMACGFGYQPSVNEYKIVRIYYTLKRPSGKFQVYTLGSGSQWRDVTGQITLPLQKRLQSADIYCSHCPFVNGALHWLDTGKEMNIVAFDLADEVFHLLPIPPCVLTEGDSFLLQELGGCLCVIHYKPADEVDIWLSKNKNKSSRYVVNEDFSSLSWIKEYAIKTELTFYPISITNDGVLLFWHNYSPRDESVLCRCNPNLGTLENLVDGPEGFLIYDAIPHMSSLVSLKALEPECRLRERYTENPTINPNDVKRQGKPKEKEEVDT